MQLNARLSSTGSQLSFRISFVETYLPKTKLAAAFCNRCSLTDFSYFECLTDFSDSYEELSTNGLLGSFYTKMLQAFKTFKRFRRLFVRSFSLTL